MGMHDLEMVIYAVFKPGKPMPVYLTFSRIIAQEKAAEFGGEIKPWEVEKDINGGQ